MSFFGEVLTVIKCTPNTKFEVGQTVRVTYIWYGGAVYDRNGKITNSNSPGIKTVRTGVVISVELEGKTGPLVVRFRPTDPRTVLDWYQFYPQDINNQRSLMGPITVEVLESR